MDKATKPQVPVTILTGFLGAGKTSLLNHILTSGHGRRIAVLVNDFGAINIDAELIDNRDGEVVSLANGCICCSLSEGLLMSVVRLIQSEHPPEHIVVETSGVSDPFEVAATFCDPELQPYRTLTSLVSPVAFLAAGVALVPPARVRPWLAPLGALATGAAFASFVRLTYPMFGDPGVVKAGIMFGLWVIVASALSVGAFRQPWFAIAGPIVGSWFIGIALLDGGAVLLR